MDQQLLLLAPLGRRGALVGEALVDPGGGIADRGPQGSLQVKVAAAGAFAAGTVDGRVSQNLPEPLDQLAFAVASEIIEAAVGFEQSLLDEIGPVKAQEEAWILVKLSGLQQKERAIFSQMPISGPGHGYLVIKRQRQGAGARLMIDQAAVVCNGHSLLTSASARVRPRYLWRRMASRISS